MKKTRTKKEKRKLILATAVFLLFASAGMFYLVDKFVYDTPIEFGGGNGHMLSPRNVLDRRTSTETTSSTTEIFRPEWISCERIEKPTVTAPLMNEDNEVEFKCSWVDSDEMETVTFYWNYTGDWVANEVKRVDGNTGTVTFKKSNLETSYFEWNCYYCNEDNDCYWNDNDENSTYNYTSAETIQEAWQNETDKLVDRLWNNWLWNYMHADQPVCGNDGIDYENPYYACKRVSSYYEGECR